MKLCQKRERTGDVGLCEVHDVDVVTHGGAIARVVVVSKHLQHWPHPCCHLHSACALEIQASTHSCPVLSSLCEPFHCNAHPTDDKTGTISAAAVEPSLKAPAGSEVATVSTEQEA